MRALDTNIFPPTGAADTLFDRPVIVNANHNQRNFTVLILCEPLLQKLVIQHPLACLGIAA
jgi:hypothetical protein